MHSTNHLLFIEYLKLLINIDDILCLIAKEVVKFFDVLDLEINKDKVSVNSQASADAVVMLEDKDGYQQFKIIRDNGSYQS
ncbi:hypothetical protein PAEPH01_0458 [Pancytospora epiphaga]|nr:hypothetical protein PAEPH01_0458 [Pancytospora epiphaga]